MKATRDGFGEQLIVSGRDNEDIIVLSADLSKATRIDKFAETYPNRFFEIGIAENNMIGIASGLSEYGYKVFLASFASFLTGKYDAIRCSLAYSKAPCILVGTHSGLAIGRDGVTQMGLEDISLMRSLPNMVVLNPSTYNETVSVVKYLTENDLETPHYLRLARQPVEEIFEEDYDFVFGKGQVLSHGTDVAIFSTGCVLPDVINAADEIRSKNLSVAVINITTIKPIDRDVILKYSYLCDNIFTVEDHSIVGGLGSAIAEVLAESGNSCKLTRIGVNDVFPESGLPSDLYEKYGLSKEQIKQRVINELDK
jgi:transketolase